MKVTEVKYTKRVNTGNYEHEEFGAAAVLDEEDNVLEVFQQLKADVAAAYSGEAVAGGTKKKPKKKEEEETEEEEVEETSTDEESEEESEEETVEEEEKPKSKKKFKKTPQKYQRDNDAHKDIFGGLLKAVAPDWKKSDEGKAKAKKASMKMEGKEFLNEDGEVLPAFKAEVKKLLGKK